MKRLQMALFSALFNLLVLSAFATDARAVEVAEGYTPEQLPRADKILVIKSDYRLYLISEGVRYASFRIALGSNPVGHKVEEGDGRTPEGTYRIISHSDQSTFYKNLRISYPNAEDIRRAQARGVSPGGDVVVHGVKNVATSWIKWASEHVRDWTGYEKTDEILDEYSARIYNWTQGCIAMSNADMDLIYDLVEDATEIEIRP